MKALLRLTLVALTLGFAGVASAQYCYSPADVGGLSYGAPMVSIHSKGQGEFELHLRTVNVRCAFSRGYYMWEPTNPLETVSRHTSDGAPYEMKVLSGEARLETSNYELIQGQPMTDKAEQRVIFKLKTKEVFAKSNYVRVYFSQRMTVEMTQDGSVYRPMPVNGQVYYMDLRLPDCE